MDNKRISGEFGKVAGKRAVNLTTVNTETITPIFRCSVKDWSSFHVHAVRQRLVALDAPGIGMAGSDVGFAPGAFADDRGLCVYLSDGRCCIHSSKRPIFLNVQIRLLVRMRLISLR